MKDKLEDTLRILWKKSCEDKASDEKQAYQKMYEESKKDYTKIMTEGFTSAESVSKFRDPTVKDDSSCTIYGFEIVETAHKYFTTYKQTDDVKTEFDSLTVSELRGIADGTVDALIEGTCSFDTYTHDREHGMRMAIAAAYISGRLYDTDFQNKLIDMGEAKHKFASDIYHELLRYTKTD